MRDFRCCCGRVLFRAVVLIGRVQVRCRDCRAEHEWNFGDVLTLDKLSVTAVVS